MIVFGLVRKILIILYKIVFNTYYIFLKLTTKHCNNKAVFVLSRDSELEGNLLHIHQEMLKQLKHVEIHLIYPENKMNLKLFKELTVICNARYLILDDYYLPIYLINPSKKLKVIQLWHAAGALKKVGYSTLGTKFGPKETYLKLVPIHSNYTHVYVSTKNIIPFYAEAFNMSKSNIYPLGIPRIDFFNDENQKTDVLNNIYRDFPDSKDPETVNILFAPTYRAKGTQQETSFGIIESIIDASTYAKENIRIYFKPHPYICAEELNSLENHPNIVVAKHYDINEWMLVADAFITDYSSSVFEFALLERPIAHFVPDIDEYTKNRGLYQSIETVSDGAIILHVDMLVEWLNAREKNECFDTSNMINLNFDSRKDISKTIVKHFISN